MLSRTLILAVLLGTASLLLVGGPALGEDETKEPGRPQESGAQEAVTQGVWAFDIRVVRIETTTPEVTETPWNPAEGTTTRLAWADLLAQMKKRGTTTLLLDQRITGLPDLPLEAMQQRDQQIRQFQNSDMHNERWQGSNLRAGCKATMKPLSSGILEYSVVVNWMLPARESDLRPLLFTAAWKGVHPALHGDTLVLSYREQLEHLDRERQGVEIYAFVTGRVVR